MVQQFTIFLADSTNTLESSFVSSVQEDFGSVRAALLSLFMAISGGQDWGSLYKLVKATGTLNSSFFLAYILLIWLSITNIIISIFCDKAIKLAQPDLDESLLAKRRIDLEKVRSIKSFFKSLDLNQSGTLSVSELQQCMHDMRTATYFEMMGLDIKDAELFFAMLTSMSGKEEVDVHTFVTGWLKLKGAATSLDVYTVQYQTELLEEKMLNEIAAYKQDMMQLRQEMIEREIAHGQDQDQRDAEMSRNRSVWQREVHPVEINPIVELVREHCLQDLPN